MVEIVFYRGGGTVFPEDPIKTASASSPPSFT
jgi:hypothetical protein